MKVAGPSNHGPMLAEPAQRRTVGPAFRDSVWLNRRAAYLSVVAIILCIYSYPALRTAITTGNLRLPAVSAPDVGLYLSISSLQKNSEGEILNPYYHVGVPYAVSYLKFRLGPMLFGLLNHLFAGRVWLTLFVWNLLCWSLLCAAAIWLFHCLLPQPPVELVLAALALLTLFSPDGISRAATPHLSLSWVPVALPYIRPFAPQFMMPLFLCYLGLLIRALSGASLRLWGTMAALQFVAFTAFPYATMMMAGTTAIAAIWYLFAGPRTSRWRVVLGFTVVCALLDLAFALHGSGGFRLSFPDQTSLIMFQPHLLGKTIGKVWILTGIMVVVAALTPRVRPEVKWPLVGMGLSNMLFALGDAFVSERVFYLSDHSGYFYQSTLVILMLVLVSAYLPNGAHALRLTRIASLATVVLCAVYGFLVAGQNYRVNLAYNLEQSDFTRWMERGEVSADDLIITQFGGAPYDSCEWIPLLSNAESLYCRNAQLTLTPEQNRDLQRPREVLYLYLSGKDEHWVENTTDFERYGLYGELSSFRSPEERLERIGALREELLPLFERIEHDDPSIHDFFRRFRRVWIVQNRQKRMFVDSRLESYLDLKGQELAGDLLVVASNPK